MLTSFPHAAMNTAVFTFNRPKIDLTPGVKTNEWKAECNNYSVNMTEELVLTAFGRPVPKFTSKRVFALPRTGPNAILLPEKQEKVKLSAEEKPDQVSRSGKYTYKERHSGPYTSMLAVS